MIKKEFYTSPEVDVFTLQFEGVVCQSLNGSGGNKFTDPGAVVDDGDPSIFW